MAVTYRIRDSRDALEISVRNEISLFLRVAYGGFAGWLVWFVISTYLPSVWRSVLAIVLGLCVAVFFRVTTAKSLATKFEFQVDGTHKRGPRRRAQTILTAKVYRLEYQEHESGGQGIYAVTAFGEPQLLPYVDGAQADEIMAAIKTKFPGLADMWKRSEDAAAKGRG